jgi:outer membrane protein assembly factor BamB
VGSDRTLFGIARDLDSERWSQQLPQIIKGKPELVGNRVFVTTWTSLTASPDHSSIFAIKASTGEIDWRLELPNEDIYPPARDPHDPETILVRNRTSLHGVSRDGRLQWTIDGLPEQTSDMPQYTDSLRPWGDDRFIYVTSAESIIAIDRATHEEAWRVSVSGPLNPPVSDDDQVYVPAGGDGLIVVDRETGDKRWTINDDTPGGDLPDSVGSYARPIVDDTGIYAQLGGHYTSLAEDGSIEWTTQLRSTIPSNPVSVGGFDFMSTTNLVKIHRGTGRKSTLARNVDSAFCLGRSEDALFVSDQKDIIKYRL